jgi:hypothetical protein
MARSSYLLRCSDSLDCVLEKTKPKVLAESPAALWNFQNIQQHLEWTTIGPSGTERATHKDEDDYTEIRFNSKQIRRLAAQISSQKAA